MLGLHEGLLSMGVESWILTGRKVLEVKNCVVAPVDQQKEPCLKDIALELIWKNRTPVSNTHFSLDCAEGNLLDQPMLREADVIHLHWVSGILSSSSIAGLAILGKPVVWTLHDMRPLTGGCHFSAGCLRYREDCGSCIQLQDDILNFTRRTLLRMAAAAAVLKPSFVAPSRWMHQIVQGSSVARGLSSYCIPYGVDTDHFRPGSRKEAREILGLVPDADYILLASHSMLEKRKGASHAINILNALAKDPLAQSRIALGKLRLLCCGHPTEDLRLQGWVIDHTGYRPASEMPYVYQSANIMLFTSTEDNLPNVILESMACGLPVVAHSVGGIPDLLGACCNEMLFPVGDIKKGALLISKWIQETQQLSEKGLLCSEYIRNHNTLIKQAIIYCELYENLIQQVDGRSTGISDLVKKLEKEGSGFFTECCKTIKNKEQHKMCSQYHIMLQSKWVRLGQKLRILPKP
jgi:glycosyltransferase involved in cell wall biosynthesis